MSQRTGGIRQPLANATVYSLFQRALGADRVRRRFVGEHLKPKAGERILDLGCGPGDILALMPPVRYVGVDNSAPYVVTARERFAGRGQFRCGDVRDLTFALEERFDAVISVGVLHHLDEVAAAGMIALAARLLVPDGRLVTLDPALTEPQNRFARWLIGRDRGQSVRTPEGYRGLAMERFASVSVSVLDDVARIPYTHAVVVCHGPKS